MKASGGGFDSLVQLAKGDGRARATHLFDRDRFGPARIGNRVKQCAGFVAQRRRGSLGHGWRSCARSPSRVTLQPQLDRIYDIGFVLGDKVGCLGPAVYVGVGKSNFEVAKITIRKDRVLGSPQQQAWDFGQLAEPVGDVVEDRAGWMVWFHRDVFDEVFDRVAPFRC